MARRVFFSFHYERDVWRASQVRKSDLTKIDRNDAGFWDAAKWEQVQRQGDKAVEKWIDENLKGTSVTAVLIGAETCTRKWVRYEIQKSIEKGNDVIGVRIHNLRNQNKERDRRGSLDFGKVYENYSFKDLFPVYDYVNDNGYENFGAWIENAGNEQEEGIGLGDIATLAFAGLLGYGLYNSLKPKCPNCNQRITRGTTPCPHCRAYLTWK